MSDPSNDSSMEEILASIRRIISEDLEDGKIKAPAAPPPQVAQAQVARQTMAASAMPVAPPPLPQRTLGVGAIVAPPDDLLHDDDDDDIFDLDVGRAPARPAAPPAADAAPGRQATAKLTRSVTPPPPAQEPPALKSNGASAPGDAVGAPVTETPSARAASAPADLPPKATAQTPASPVPGVAAMQAAVAGAKSMLDELAFDADEVPFVRHKSLSAAAAKVLAETASPPPLPADARSDSLAAAAVASDDAAPAKPHPTPTPAAHVEAASPNLTSLGIEPAPLGPTLPDALSISSGWDPSPDPEVAGAALNGAPLVEEHVDAIAVDSRPSGGGVNGHASSVVMEAPVEPAQPEPAPLATIPAVSPPTAAPPQPLPILANEAMPGAAAPPAIPHVVPASVATLATPSARSMEDTVADMLKPMLREWLDANMPRIVERLAKDLASKS